MKLIPFFLSSLFIYSIFCYAVVYALDNDQGKHLRGTGPTQGGPPSGGTLQTPIQQTPSSVIFSPPNTTQSPRTALTTSLPNSCLNLTVPFQFTLNVPQYVSLTDGKGNLNPSYLGTYANSSLNLKIPVWNVNSNGNPPELHELFFNGVPISTLTGIQGQWILNSLPIPLTTIKTASSNPDGSLFPGVNTVTINWMPGINTSNCVQISWAAINQLPEIILPTLLVNGFQEPTSIWSTSWIPALQVLQVPYIVVNVSGTISQNAQTIKNQIASAQNLLTCTSVNVVASEKGGIDTRQYLTNINQEDVSSFIALQSPNCGITTQAQFQCTTLVNTTLQSACQEMSKSNMQIYNSDVATSPANVTQFVSVSGGNQNTVQQSSAFCLQYSSNTGLSRTQPEAAQNAQTYALVSGPQALCKDVTETSVCQASSSLLQSTLNQGQSRRKALEEIEEIIIHRTATLSTTTTTTTTTTAATTFIIEPFHTGGDSSSTSSSTSTSTATTATATSTTGSSTGTAATTGTGTTSSTTTSTSTGGILFIQPNQQEVGYFQGVLSATPTSHYEYYIISSDAISVDFEVGWVIVDGENVTAGVECTGTGVWDASNSGSIDYYEGLEVWKITLDNSLNVTLPANCTVGIFSTSRLLTPFPDPVPFYIDVNINTLAQPYLTINSTFPYGRNSDSFSLTVTTPKANIVPTVRVLDVNSNVLGTLTPTPARKKRQTFGPPPPIGIFYYTLVLSSFSSYCGYLNVEAVIEDYVVSLGRREVLYLSAACTTLSVTTAIAAPYVTYQPSGLFFEAIGINFNVVGSDSTPFCVRGELWTHPSSFGALVISPRFVSIVESCVTTFTAGQPTQIDVLFPRQDIYNQKFSGPYAVQNFLVYATPITPSGPLILPLGNIGGFESVTASYPFYLFLDETNPFLPLLASTDQGIDPNINSLYQFLQVTITTIFPYSGNITFTGTLLDQNSNVITAAQNQTVVVAAQLTPLILSFSGHDIRTHGVNGTYNAGNVLVYNTNSTITTYTLIDTNPTNSYNFTQFGP